MKFQTFIFKIFIFLFSISITAQKNKNLHYEQDSIAFKKTMKKALCFFKERQLDSFKKYSQLSFKLSEKSEKIQKIHFYLATYYKYKEIPDSAYYHYHQSNNILLKLGDTLIAGKRLTNIGLIQLKENDLLGSEITYIQALKYIIDSDLYGVKHKIYNSLGIIFQQKKNFKDALKYYNLSLNELKKYPIKSLHLKLNVINNKGVLYQGYKQHKKAIFYFKQGLAYDDIKEKYPKKYALLLENLAFCNYQLGKKTSVLKQYKEVLKIWIASKDFSKASTTHLNMSYIYKDSKQYKKAIDHSNIALDYAKKTHNNRRWLEALENLSELTKSKQAKKYLQEYIHLNDSLFEKERRLKNQFAKIRYETDKKEKENTVLKKENESKQLEIVYHKQQQVIGWLAAASGLLLFISSVLFYFYRKRKLLYQAQLERITAREDERQQIAKSLHDEVAGDLQLLYQKLKKSNLLEEAEKLDTVKENVRNLSHQLSSISFNKVSFEDQIINLVSDYFELDFKIMVTGLQEYNWKNINDAIKRLLYLSTRESIQNCKKHAKTSKVIITFTIHKKYVFLQIKDTGIGFDTNTNKKGIGLQNLQERVEELNGTLHIKSEIDNGTLTSIQIPLNAWTNKNTLS